MAGSEPTCAAGGSFCGESNEPARTLPVAARRDRVWLAVEYTALFWLAPLAYLMGWAGPYPLLALCALALACGIALLRDPTFDRNQLWNREGARQSIVSIVLVLLVGIAGAGTLGLLGWPYPLTPLAQHAAGTWLTVLVIYPLLSVYPQELVWRAFAMHRYRPLLGDGSLAIANSALAFAWAHVIFGNWIAPAVSLAGGLLFAWRYVRTRSLAAVSIEHMLWGQLLFVAGLWTYFGHAATP